MAQRRRKGSKGPQLQIVNGEMLRSVLQRVLDYCGSHRKAAKHLGVQQTTFTRLLNGKVKKRITSETYGRIRDALRDNTRESYSFDLESDFEESVLGWEQASFVKGRYDRWLREEYERLVRKAGWVFSALYMHPEYQDIFTVFLRNVRRRPELPAEDEKRLWIALYRAVEPLGTADEEPLSPADDRRRYVSEKASDEMARVERTWQEMHKAGELRPFLKHALAGERLMRKRPHDMERLRAIKPPSSIWSDWPRWPPKRGWKKSG